MDEAMFAHNGAILWKHVDAAAVTDVIASSCVG